MCRLTGGQTPELRRLAVQRGRNVSSLRVRRCREARLSARRQRGFSVVEALVSALIVSVGLLGVGELILFSLRECAAALSHTQAVALVSDMIERIRANPDAGDAYDCASYTDEPAEHGCAPSGAPAGECTARELAEDDLARWQAFVRQSLPRVGARQCDANVTYYAAVDESEPAKYHVVVSWRPPGQEAASKLTGVLLVDGGRGT
jgi:type IV pilus assembly protein PilV